MKLAIVVFVLSAAFFTVEMGIFIHDLLVFRPTL